MKVLVTGGLGFIGSHFVRSLIQKNIAVVNLDKQTYSGNPENLKDIETSPYYTWIKGDIVDFHVVSTAMKDCDYVVHFAAETHVDRSVLDPEAFLKTNVTGTYTLLKTALSNKIKLFIHISTDEVYGSVEEGESVETDSLEPNSPYSASKASSDLFARSYFVTYNLPVITTRCSNNFGPYQFPEKALPLLITNALEDKPFPLYGTGTNVRDWLYVVDHVRAINLLLEKGVPGEIYNIGGTCSIENKTLFEEILTIMGKPKELLHYIEDRPGHDKRYALNCKKIQKLGWKPETSFQGALKDTISWYTERRDWWHPIKTGKSFEEYYNRQYGQRMRGNYR